MEPFKDCMIIAKNKAKDIVLSCYMIFVLKTYISLLKNKTLIIELLFPPRISICLH